jgi:hypothetical protein
VFEYTHHILPLLCPAAIPIAHLILTGASQDKSQEELTTVLKWSLEQIHEWFPHLPVKRLMTDRCAAHIKAFAQVEGKFKVNTYPTERYSWR